MHRKGKKHHRWTKKLHRGTTEFRRFVHDAPSPTDTGTDCFPSKIRSLLASENSFDKIVDTDIARQQWKQGNRVFRPEDLFHAYTFSNEVFYSSSCRWKQWLVVGDDQWPTVSNEVVLGWWWSVSRTISSCIDDPFTESSSTSKPPSKYHDQKVFLREFTPIVFILVSRYRTRSFRAALYQRDAKRSATTTRQRWNKLRVSPAMRTNRISIIRDLGEVLESLPRGFEMVLVP